ncbi:MAG: TonB-dependent receptor [Pseudomonadota bacterium]
MRRFSELSALFLSGTVIVMASSTFACAQAVDRQIYDMPAQPLSQSIKALAAAARRSILAPTSLLDDHQAPALRGHYTVEEALDVLLAGSGLRARRTGRVIVIEPEARAPGADTAEAESEITVTGSRLRGGPIGSTVISLAQQQMRDQGQASLGEVVRSIPQSFGGGQNPGVGSNVPSTNGVNVGGASSVNLRGIGSDATLTLLNGHRLSYSASRQSIDIGAIPLPAVDRIEIVPDGASALYGSDAVAGVVNVVLKPDYDGLWTSARLGGATDGGDFEQRYGLIAGQRWNGGGIAASYEFARTTAILGRQRSYVRDRSPTLTILPQAKTSAALVTAHQRITGGLSLTVDGLYNQRWAESSFANNAAGDPSISGSHTVFRVESLVVAPTLKLQTGGDWRLFATGSYGRDRTHFQVTSTSASKATTTPLSCYCNSAMSAEVGGDGSLFTLPGGPVRLALGTGYRTNDFSRFNGAGNLQNVARSQDSYYAYGELGIPLVMPAQGIAFVHRLELDGALRYEDYPGIGNIVTPKIGGVYAPTPDFAFKGSWGKSFRAPTMLQQFQARSATLIPAGSLGSTTLPAASAVLYLQGGNPDLLPERATTWSATLDLHPRALGGARLEISYFNIHYKDRIVTPIAFLSQALGNPVYADRVTLAPSAARVTQIVSQILDFSNITAAPYDPATVVAIVDNSNVNAGRQTIKGVDALFSYRAALGGAQSLTASLNASYLKSDQQISSTQPVLPLAGILFNPPHLRARGSLSWDTGSLLLNTTVSRIGSVDDTRTNPRIRIGPMTTLDLTVRYRFMGGGLLGGTDIAVSAMNLFNAKPDQIKTTLFSQTPYDSTNYSPIGRFLSVSIAKKW